MANLCCCWGMDLSLEEDKLLTADLVASVPPPGLAGPSQVRFAPGSSQFLSFIATHHKPKSSKLHRNAFRPLTTPAAPVQTQPAFNTNYSTERVVQCLNLGTQQHRPLLKRRKRRNTEGTLEERLRRESVAAPGTQFSWTRLPNSDEDSMEALRLLIPVQGSLFVQDGLQEESWRCVYQAGPPAYDAQLSPDGSKIAWVSDGELHVQSIQDTGNPTRISFGAVQSDTTCISHGLADFVAQEEIDRYRGFWWHPDSTGILFTRVDESDVPVYRILHTPHHQHYYVGVSDNNSSSQHDGAFASLKPNMEDHRYPFAGKANPKTTLGYISLPPENGNAETHWNEHVLWFDAPREAHEYLARVHWLPDGAVLTQWQNRAQTCSVLYRYEMTQKRGATVWLERSTEGWLNLHHNLMVLHPIHPRECGLSVNCPTPLPAASFSFVFASEQSGFQHLYLFTYVRDGLALQLRNITQGDWMVEHVCGVAGDTVYFTGTYDHVLERHLYRTSLRGTTSSELSSIQRLTTESGMHSIVMDDACRYYVDTSSDLGRPTTVKIYDTATQSLVLNLYDASRDDKSMDSIAQQDKPVDLVKCLPPPELLSFPSSDGSATLHAALYRPDPAIHGPGPYPLVCAVYGGPHVQRVNRSWSQCADMRAQRLRSMGFCVIKCDNRGSSRRGVEFEQTIARRLGRYEVLDQVAAVRQLVVRGVVDPNRVGVYGWSYGGYLAAMCLCRAPDVFRVAVAGAPVTSWDGYDTHYTERYMGLPADNPLGYRESAVFDHVPNMRGNLMIVHGLIDENVHFQHTSRLINKLIAAGKPYDLLIFPEERHSPRRLRDRIYMEQRISDYFVRHLTAPSTALDIMSASMRNGNGTTFRTMAGHL